MSNTTSSFVLSLTEDFSTAHGEPEAIFTQIYEQNIWRDGESVSGRGSSLKATEDLRIKLAEFFREKNTQTLLDIPCGDFNWFRAIDYKLKRYVGYDIVKALIENNQEKYSSPSVQFRHANILQEAFEDADVALCRDFVIHSSNDDVFAFFTNLRKSRIPQILLSQYQNCKVQDIHTGNRYRPVDFRESPFLLPEPIAVIQEDIQHMYDTANRHAADPSRPLEKFLGYWETEAIYHSLDQNAHYQDYLTRRNHRPLISEYNL